MQYLYFRRSIIRKSTPFIWVFTLAALALLYWCGWLT